MNLPINTSMVKINGESLLICTIKDLWSTDPLVCHTDSINWRES